MDPNDRQRKDRLIQTRVPQNLESTLKDEARKRRLSVSHLIRNVLEDTFHLVDNVVSEVDRVVADSVGMAQTLKRDAQRLAATARGQTSHREGAAESEVPASASAPQAVASPETPPHGVSSSPPPDPDSASSEPPADEADALRSGALADVFGFQELVLNRTASCASCGSAIARGTHAFLGMTDQPGPRVWVCPACIADIQP
jgi:hypothetical protein